jgi:hypothetical protein
MPEPDVVDEGQIFSVGVGHGYSQDAHKRVLSTMKTASYCLYSQGPRNAFTASAASGAPPFLRNRHFYMLRETKVPA